MVRLLWFLSIALTAVVIGSTSAIYATQTLKPTGMLTIGPWEAVQSVGASAADPYAHAFLASSGQLPPGTAEGIRFVALNGSDGRPLIPACRVTVSGVVDLASFWTLTLTQVSGEPLASPEARQTFALHSQDIIYHADGSFELSIGPQPSSINALLTPLSTPIALVLHVYDGALTTLPDANETALPRVEVNTSGARCPL